MINPREGSVSYFGFVMPSARPSDLNMESARESVSPLVSVTAYWSKRIFKEI